jgi:hypothetical protein
MEHVFSMLFARGASLHRFAKNKKLFVNATFLLALCARPYPLPLGRKQQAIRVYPVCHVVIVGTLHRAIVSHGLHGRMVCESLWAISFS